MLETKKTNEILMMYHGMVAPERGIENLIRTLNIDDSLMLMVIGNGTNEYINSLENLAKDLNVKNRILFHEAVSNRELWKYIGAADVGMVTVRAAWKSYYYMLPNKLFENIQAETPVVSSDFPVIKSMVDKYGIGVTCNPDDIESIVKAIHEVCDDKQKYNQMKERIKKAKEELCWEKEKKVLKEVYKKII